VIINQNYQSSRFFDRKYEKLHVDTMKRLKTKILFFRHLNQNFNLNFDNVKKIFDAIMNRLNYLIFVVNFANVYIHENFFHDFFNQKIVLKRYLINYNKH
jgi:hypothetical protein